MNIEKIKSYVCPVEAAMDVIGGKYKAQIVYELLDGTKRYSEIQRALPQATPRMLSKQLKELRKMGSCCACSIPWCRPEPNIR